MASGDVIAKVADKETLDKAYANTNAILAAVGEDVRVKGVKRYGIKINKNDGNPATRCTYLFDAVGMTPAAMNYTTGAFDFGDWGDVFFVKNNYPAMVKYDGTEDYKLDPNDHTKKIDGTTASDVANTSYGGNAMSVFDGSGDKGKIWLSQFEIGNYEYMIISNVQYDESYNDDAYVREDGSHADKLYYPMFGGSYDGTRIRSIAEQALMYNTNATTEITRAKANGEGWNIGSWSKRNLLNCMLKIMSKTDNSQAAFGQGQTSGYVDDASQNYGHLPTGTLKDKGQFFGYNDTTHEVKVFYIEKWWGNRWDRINGMLMVGGEILAKMTPPYNLTGAGFDKVGIKFTGKNNGYQKETKSSGFGRIPKTLGGSSSTYTCDYFSHNDEITAVALVGGYCNVGANCGAGCLGLSNSAGDAHWNVGASVFLEQPIAA
ncbi:MAG: hypothetical protein KH828_01575 [Clostridiales bacterium]|nr:hypothetical protein [Clostridiales bacterium]